MHSNSSKGGKLWHNQSRQSLANGPDAAVYVLVFLFLSETFCLQSMRLLELNVRLYVTALFSLIGQVFLISDIFSLWRIAAHPEVEALRTIHVPIAICFPLVTDFAFLALSLMNIILHALAQLVVEGHITTSIFGHPSQWPAPGDDFGIAIVRYGAACLEATKVRIRTAPAYFSPC